MTLKTDSNSFAFSEKIEKLLDSLKTSKEGLKQSEVTRRLEEFGKNEISSTSRRSLFRIFIDQFQGLLIAILIFAAIISGIIGETTDSIAILIILFLNQLSFKIKSAPFSAII